MRAAVTIDDDEVLRVEDSPDPTPGPNDLVLAVDACGICGSDLHLAQVLRSYPGVVFGHEFCGRVVATGADVSDWSEGDRAVGFPLTGCGRCQACIAGHTSKCAEAVLTGLQRPGAFAQYVAVGAREAFRLPDELSATHGALVEPLAVALHALDRTPRDPGAPVLILGGGPVGLATALWALHLGAGHVLVSDPVAARRQLAEKLGAVTIDPTAGDVGVAFADLTGTPPRAVVECVGVPGLIQHAADVAAVDGHVTVVGACVQPDQIIPTTALAKELTLQFVLYYRNRDFRTTIDAMSSGQLDPLPLVTDQISLEALPGRFRALMEPTTEAKVLVSPRSQTEGTSS